MACQSCAAKQQSVAGRFAKSVTVTTFEVPEECVYSKEQIEEKLALLEASKGEVEKKQITALSVKIFKLKRALKEYDVNCNKYLKDLDGLLKN